MKLYVVLNLLYLEHLVILVMMIINHNYENIVTNNCFNFFVCFYFIFYT